MVNEAILENRSHYFPKTKYIFLFLSHTEERRRNTICLDLLFKEDAMSHGIFNHLNHLNFTTRSWKTSRKYEIRMHNAKDDFICCLIDCGRVNLTRLPPAASSQLFFSISPIYINSNACQNVAGKLWSIEEHVSSTKCGKRNGICDSKSSVLLWLTGSIGIDNRRGIVCSLFLSSEANLSENVCIAPTTRVNKFAQKISATQLYSNTKIVIACCSRCWLLAVGWQCAHPLGAMQSTIRPSIGFGYENMCVAYCVAPPHTTSTSTAVRARQSNANFIKCAVANRQQLDTIPCVCALLFRVFIFTFGFEWYVSLAVDGRRRQLYLYFGEVKRTFNEIIAHS